ncbi:MAG: DUF488 family protein [Methanomassiliicoccales archaeon]
MTIYTIGFAKKNLREFIKRLQQAGVNKVVDIRLNNTSQLAGYSKKDDLAYVLELVGIGYEHLPELAPTAELMEGIKSKSISWAEFETAFNDILQSRHAEQYRDLILNGEGVCLLCAEDKPKGCHRSLVADYFAAMMPGTGVRHL